jgi:cell division protein FtsL
VPPPDPRPPTTLIEANAERESPRESAGRVGRAETLALKLMKLLFFACIVLCAVGADRIACARREAQLASQLRQAEKDAQTAMQAYRQLQSQMAIQPAPQPWPAETHLVRTVKRAPRVSRAAHGLLASRNQPRKVELHSSATKRTKPKNA